MPNKTALYILLAALVLALLTNRWMAGGARPAFNIVSFDEWYFNAQWIAFAMTLGGLLLLASDWHDSGRFPPLVLLGVALLLFFVATGIPQTQNAYEWKAGDVGFVRWMRVLHQRNEADEVAPHLLGTWKSGTRSYLISRDSLTVASQDKTDVLNAASCPSGIDFKFAYATDQTLHFNPAAYRYYALLEGPPLPSLEVACSGRLYTFIRLADGTVLAFRGLHEANPLIETLAR